MDTHILTELRPNLQILLYSKDGTCDIKNTLSIFETQKAMALYNIPVNIHCNDPNLPEDHSRNNMIARALCTSSASHFLFVDANISWSYEDVIKMIVSKKNIIGGAVPKSMYNWPKLTGDHISKKETSAIESNYTYNPRISALRYHVGLINGTLEVSSGISKVAYLHSGFMMLRRSAIEKLHFAYPQSKYQCDYLTPEENKYAYALFGSSVVNDKYLTTYEFLCNRWCAMGNSVWIVLETNVSINKKHEFVGCYHDTLIHG